MSVQTISNLNKNQGDLRYVSGWRNDTDSIPIYHVDTPHAFNRVVGYARYINSTTGTVLYRGQNEKYTSLLPSGARPGKVAVSEKVFDDVCADNHFIKVIGLGRKEIIGWKEFNYMLIEAVLQHYGANTYCMDFVDNHWCALWFGLYKFENNHYHERSDDGKLYVFLYVAETAGSCVGGMYIGDETYTVDLRKALPSIFQRPASQHGWVVRHKERKSVHFDDRIVGVIEIDVENARKWLGNGELLSEDNFFPSYEIDQGYKVLLKRQRRSGIECGKNEILPQNTICNYHMHEMIYCSDYENLSKIRATTLIPAEIKVVNIIDVFELLLSVGWNENTCSGNMDWNEKKPYNGQSAVTAILLQRWFGGDICSREYYSKAHYFNIINGTVVDLTHSELLCIDEDEFYNPLKYRIMQTKNEKVHRRYNARVDILIENCKKRWDS